MGKTMSNKLRKSLVGFAAFALVLAACSDDDAEQGDPEAALNTYAAAINAHSLDDAMAAFAEDSRMIDHPLNPVELNGKEEIRRGVSQTVNLSREDPDPYAISNVVAEGNTVSWSYVWVNSSDLEYCSDGNEIDVNSDGLIVEYRQGERSDCDE
jgi:ketosteroid isomerase-like protein